VLASEGGHLLCYAGLVFYVYILQLSDGTYYTGFSEDLSVRVRDHKGGRIVHTRGLNPQLAFYCAFQSKKKALDFEKYLKSNSGFAFRNKRLI